MPATALLNESVRTALDDLGIAYEAMECDPEFADTAAFCARYGIPPANSANTIIVAGKAPERTYVACVVLATAKVDVNKTVCRELGVRKASFASADETKELTGMLIGGVTPFGLPRALKLLIDAAVMDQQYVVVGGGNRSSKIRLNPGELLRVPHARVVESLGIPTG